MRCILGELSSQPCFYLLALSSVLPQGQPRCSLSLLEWDVVPEIFDHAIDFSIVRLSFVLIKHPYHVKF
jgi:hypothetical protein